MTVFLTVSAITVLVSLGGYLYLRSKIYERELDQQFKIAKDLQINKFDIQIENFKKRDKTGAYSTILNELQDDANSLKLHDYHVIENTV